MSVIDDIIESEKDYEVASEMHVTDWRADRAAAELAALRAAVEQAREIIDDAMEFNDCILDYKNARAWLDAHPAPQPQEDQTNHG